MSNKKGLKELNEKIKKVKEQKASVLAKLENLAKQKLPRKVKKAKREPLQKEWQRLWDELKSLYAKRKELVAEGPKKVSAIKPKRSKEDQEKVKELKSRKKGILKEIEKVKKDASLSKEEKKAKSKELREKWQSLMNEINDLVKGKKPVEKPVSKKELAIKHLEKANIRQDPRFIKIVEDVLKETKDKTPGEIRDLIEDVSGKNMDFLMSMQAWVEDSYQGEFLDIWQGIQDKKLDIFDEERYNFQHIGLKGERRKEFEDTMVKVNTLTTQYYKKRGIDELRVYRGIQDSQGKFKKYQKILKKGEKVKVEVNPLSSWTLKFEEAKTFGSVVLEVKVPVERIDISQEAHPDIRLAYGEVPEIIVDGQGLMAGRSQIITI